MFPILFSIKDPRENEEESKCRRGMSVRSAQSEKALFERAGLLKRMYGIKIIVSREGRNSEEVEKAEKQKRAIWCGSKSSGLGRHRWVPSSWVESLASFFGIDHAPPSPRPPPERWFQFPRQRRCRRTSDTHECRQCHGRKFRRLVVIRLMRQQESPYRLFGKVKSAFLPLIRFTEQQKAQWNPSCTRILPSLSIKIRVLFLTKRFDKARKNWISNILIGYWIWLRA